MLRYQGDCGPGHWCLSGVDREYPDGPNATTPLNNTCYDDRLVGSGSICPIGHYCPGGVASYLPLACDNGTYADVEGLSACKDCPVGKYCKELMERGRNTNLEIIKSALKERKK